MNRPKGWGQRDKKRDLGPCLLISQTGMPKMKTYIGKAWFGPPRGALRSLNYLAIPKLLLLLTVEQRVKGGGLSLLEKKN